MKSNCLFTDKQYGFITGRFTVLQRTKVQDRWTEILDQGYAVVVSYCDFAKAFDMVPHE